MKRLMSIFLALAMALTLCACGNDGNVTEPSQSSSPTTAPAGSNACPHTPEIVQLKPATCTEAGLRISACPLCGEEFRDEIPAPGHSFTEASCTAGSVCTVCGLASDNALGHNYKDGLCIHCGDKLPEDIPADCEHDYSLTGQTAPTCAADGKMEYSCSKCGHTYIQVIASTGHHLTDATCSSPQICTLCQHTQGQPLGHNYLGGECTRCGEADPTAAKEVTYTVTVRSDKGKLIEGVTVSVFTGSDMPAATGVTNAKGVAKMQLMSADSYTIVLSNIPSGLSAKTSYTFRSTTVNINLATVAQITPEDHSKANYKAGSTMGDFTLTDTDGNTYQLSQLLKEKDLVILNFWFVNCGPCKAEFPYFEAFYQKYDNVQLLTLNHLDSEADIKSLRQQMGVTFPMIHETIGFQQGFGITAYPTTVFIDSTGRILKIQVGEFHSLEELENVVASLMK